MADVNVDNVIAAYVKLREQRAVLKKTYENEDALLKGKMDRLEAWLMAQMQQSGATQLGSAHGTAYQQTLMKGGCSDWPTFWNFIQQTGRFDMLEKRVSSKCIQEYYQETNELPPGVSVSPELRVIVRKG